MKEKTLLFELCSLFDLVSGKVCPVLATDAMTVPATFVRICGAERCEDGRLKVIFELKHRYRDVEVSAALSAAAYLEKLCRAAEDGGAVLCSMSCGGFFDTSAGECTARFEYYSGDTLSVKIGESDISSVLKGINVEEKGIVKESRYIYGADVHRRRIGSSLRVTLRCAPGAASVIINAFGTVGGLLTVAVGADAFRGRFILSELDAGGTVRAELLSSGSVEYVTLDLNGGGGTV